MSEQPLPQQEVQEAIKPQKQPDFVYGSGRFESVTTNNSNAIFLEETKDVTKIVLGKDVVMTMPESATDLDPWQPYPTHQEAWLPMWFIMSYHSNPKTPEARKYVKELAGQVDSEDRQLMTDALLHKANEFWEAYKQTPADKPPRKKYKQFTRILQDVMLYVDAPDIVEDQDTFLSEHPLAELIALSNDFRNGEQLERVGEVELRIEQMISDKIKDRGGSEAVKSAFERMTDMLAEGSSKGKVVLVENADISDAAHYAELINYDLVIAQDEHDEDVISIVSDIDSPGFQQVDVKFGPGLSEERRRDVISVPSNLEPWAVVKEGKESYQPVSMIVATHVEPVTESGRKMYEQIAGEWRPEDVAHHYLGAAEEFLHREAWGKSYVRRFGRDDVRPIKQVIPLYRVACDLLPRAVYMLKKGAMPAGVDNEELWEVGETAAVAEKIQEFFERQDASETELREVFAGVEAVFERWYKPEYYDTFQENMRKMKAYADKSL